MSLYGLYSHGMHDLLMRELEVGWLVAIAEDNEACGFGPLFDVQAREYFERERGEE